MANLTLKTLFFVQKITLKCVNLSKNFSPTINIALTLTDSHVTIGTSPHTASSTADYEEGNRGEVTGELSHESLSWFCHITTTPVAEVGGVAQW